MTVTMVHGITCTTGGTSYSVSLNGTSIGSVSAPYQCLCNPPGFTTTSVTTSSLSSYVAGGTNSIRLSYVYFDGLSAPGSLGTGNYATVEVTY